MHACMKTAETGISINSALAQHADQLNLMMWTDLVSIYMTVTCVTSSVLFASFPTLVCDLCIILNHLSCTAQTVTKRLYIHVIFICVCVKTKTLAADLLAILNPAVLHCCDCSAVGLLCRWWRRCCCSILAVAWARTGAGDCTVSRAGTRTASRAVTTGPTTGRSWR